MLATLEQAIGTKLDAWKETPNVTLNMEDRLKVTTTPTQKYTPTAQEVEEAIVLEPVDKPAVATPVSNKAQVVTNNTTITATARTVKEIPPQAASLMHALTSKLEYLEEMHFTKDYAALERSLVRGSMDHAKVIGLNEPVDFLGLIGSLQTLVQEKEYSDRVVFQFELPSQYRAYSPWITLKDLKMRIREIPFSDEEVKKSLQMEDWKTMPNGKDVFSTLCTTLVRPMSSRLLTFTIMKKSGLVSWFAGDEPSISLSGPNNWVHLLGYCNPENHKKPQPKVIKNHEQQRNTKLVQPPSNTGNTGEQSSSVERAAMASVAVTN